MKWEQTKPEWCPHESCGFRMHSQSAVCIGKLPVPELHDGTPNTHRFCLHGAKDDGEWTFDLKLNASDVFNITRVLSKVKDD